MVSDLWLTYDRKQLFKQLWAIPVSEKLIPRVILCAIKGEKIPVYGDGKQVRDWLFVEDHARALLDLMIGGKVGETYNIGGM